MDQCKKHLPEQRKVKYTVSFGPWLQQYLHTQNIHSVLAVMVYIINTDTKCSKIIRTFEDSTISSGGSAAAGRTSRNRTVLRQTIQGRRGRLQRSSRFGWKCSGSTQTVLLQLLVATSSKTVLKLWLIFMSKSSEAVFPVCSKSMIHTESKKTGHFQNDVIVWLITSSWWLLRFIVL